MSRHRFTLDLFIEDEILALHDGDQTPPPNEIQEWDARDIARAEDAGILDLGDCEATYVEQLPDMEPA